MPKNIVVFCDGTWNRADQTTVDGRPCRTNVLRLFEATQLDDQSGNSQVIHYIEGVGTRWSERIWGGGFGFGISDNIKAGYRFIASNYEPGDKIFLLGFSRGAYTARSIAGFIRNCGILKRHKLHLVNDAYDKYKDVTPEWRPDSEASKAFRATNTYGGETIAFIGVWDTVGALGAPFGRIIGWIVDKLFKCRFHDVRLSRIIESAYHALAIDERRWPFRPTRWELSAEHVERNAAHPNALLYEEQWFRGVHSNIGGGYPTTCLSDVGLEWMAERARRRGLNVDLSIVSEPECRPDATAPIDKSQTFLYRLSTILFVKIPSLISMNLIAKDDAPYVGNVQWNGDYIRPITPQLIASSGAQEREQSPVE
jgi:uncharacterized protein (DUF2235 family)